jgi:hypothetical protein
MFTISEVLTLLEWNRVLTEKALKSNAADATRRLFELQIHRALLKDCLIELYSARVA